MTRTIRAALASLVAFFTLAAARAVENTWDFSVQVSASVQSSPARVTLTWPQDTNATPSSYTVFRRTPGSSNWGPGTPLSGSTTTYTDTAVATGNAYEYKLVKAAGSYTGYGYLVAGVHAPLVDRRGTVVLVVDRSMASPLAAELARLQQDLAGDGWTVVRRDVGRDDSVASVKAAIKSVYDADPAGVKSVFLFGHIPVPYSGQLNPDGHPDHVGAWPADAFYGDMDGNWTDSSVNYTQSLNTDPADAARLSNRPGDGKFDQIQLPSAIELQVGRVDLANLPGRTTWGGPATLPSEVELLRNYLTKDHNFRHGITRAPRRAILGDYFGARGGEAFAASGFRSFAPLVGAANIRNLNTEFNDRKGVWIPELAKADYLLAYACGAGSYATIAGLGNSGLYNDGATSELVSSNVRGVFNLLFGSWLGDWDHEDNILRAPLATSTGLVSVWSGRPHWFLHSLGAGETIGHSARLAMNNNGDYQTQINTAQNRIHIALMGDPTLRLHPVAPVGAVNGSASGNTIALSWGASNDSALLGYHVYRAASAAGPFTRLTASPIAATNFTDSSGSASATYMVRALKLENTTSGSYENPSQGVFWSAANGSSSTTSPAVEAPAPTLPPATEPVVTTPPAPGGSTTVPSLPASIAPTVPLGTVTLPFNSTPAATIPPTAGAPVGHASDVVWFDDALPAGAGGGASGGDAWTWVASSPAPFSGAVSHQSAVKAGHHEHHFNWAGETLAVGAGEKLFLYVYLDPANLPSEIMVSWCSTNWEHRAYWGADRIADGKPGTASRHYAGALPAAGQWVRLEVPAAAVALEGATLQGMSFSTFDGRATWDRVGKSTAAAAPSAPPSTTPVAASEFVWFDDATPGGGTGANGGDAWNWVTSNPAPFSGTKAHQSANVAGLHEHYFNWATPLNVATGDILFTYVYIDPAAPVTEIMLSFVSDNWEHRAYWGADRINNGTNGTASRRHAGPLPAPGQWARLEVPASALGLEGAAIGGMAFSTFDGRATFDKTGKATPASGGSAPAASPGTGPALATVTIAATDTTAVIGSATDHAVITFTRTGSTTAELCVNYTLTGSAVKWLDYRRLQGDMPVEVIIPAGQASVTMTITAVANVTNAAAPAVTFTLSPDPAYTVGSASSVALTIASSSSPSSGGSIAGSGGSPSPALPPIVTPPVDTAPTTVPPTTPINAIAENAVTRLPQVGDHALRILSPTILELQRITSKAPDPAPATDWNFVTNGVFNAPPASAFAVTVNGAAAGVKAIHFRRRVAYAPLYPRDLRIDNVLILELDRAIADGQAVAVKNPDGTLWPASMSFQLAANPLRYSPAIHVNQEGYVPSFPKKAIVGHYLGSKGELPIAATTFSIVTAATGTPVFTGTLTARKETGYTYAPLPYQQVLQADFSAFRTPGEYQLVVPGLGASLPFLIDEGIAMAFTRTYALGLYHQRSGVELKLPYTRFTHAAGHTAPVEIPAPQSAYSFTWKTIAEKNADAKNNPRHTAPQLKDEASQLYPFVNQGTVAANGGHHDAGDYSKYTINSAHLTHLLTFSADSIANAGTLDNLGLPESGDGLSDLLQEAKIEADYIAKLQDADGGFYFIVYPKNREYENNVTPANGDTQVAWPKNTAATAASVAALAQMASSPQFKAAFPAEAAAYLAKAKAGWTFLLNALAKHGKDGAYQKITFYGDNYLHDDELAWAACELFVATGEAHYHSKLKEFFPNPSDGATMRWGWWRLSESWGNAIRSYAFAARSGRLPASALDAAYLAKCEEQIRLAGDDALSWTNKSAYPTAFPQETKNVQAAGWYFSLDQASDMATAYQLNPKPEYIDALVGNLNYEGGTNPVNVTYLTGLGVRRQREIVHQWAVTEGQSLPMIGIPLGNVQSSFDFLSSYGASGNELSKLSFPSDDNSAANRYPFYDRWADTWNVTTEFVAVTQARSMVSVSMLAGLTATRTQPWKPTQTATIVVPAGVAPVGQPVTLALTGVDTAGARITWEARDQQPDFGSTYTISPQNNGAQWVEAEIVFADGRRIFATGSFTANSPIVNWVDDAIPAGATPGGSEPWTWVTSPAMSGTKAHQSVLAAGMHEHAFNDAGAVLEVGVGDTLFVNVYLDPANLPEELMLSWNDGTWEHRAFWGADKIGYGTLGTAGRFRAGDLPAAGQWVRLEVPARAVGLEGRSIKGMSFAAFGGRVTWDAAGKTSPVN